MCKNMVDYGGGTLNLDCHSLQRSQSPGVGWGGGGSVSPVSPAWRMKPCSVIKPEGSHAGLGPRAGLPHATLSLS